MTSLWLGAVEMKCNGRRGVCCGSWLCVLVVIVGAVVRPSWEISARTPSGGETWTCDLDASGGARLFPDIGADVAACVGSKDLAHNQDGECFRDSLLLHKNALNHTLWASLMVDASARGASGVLHGRRFSLGSYDGCLTADRLAPVGSRYCLARLTANYAGVPARVGGAAAGLPAPWADWRDLSPDADTRTVLQGLGRFPQETSLRDLWVALCVPRSCGALQVEGALRRAMHLRHTGATLVEVHVDADSCTSPSQQTHASLGLLIYGLACGALLTLAAVATYLDVMGLEETSQGGRRRRWMTSWSVIRRWRMLVAREEPLRGLALQPLAGVRVATVLFLVVAHHSMHLPRTPLANNFVSRKSCDEHAICCQTFLDPASTFATQGYMFVYTMFFLSGLFVALGSRESFLRAIALRYLRLTPSYMAVVAFYAFALPAVGDGPRWREMVAPEANACATWWWTNLLYVNNYVHSSRGCVLQSWSLAADMQLCIFATFLLILGKGYKKSGRLLWGVAFIFSLLAPFITTIFGLREPVWRFLPSVLEDIWGWPFWSRYVSTEQWALPYIVGIFTGLFLEKSQKSGFTLRLRTMAVVLSGCGALMTALLVSGVVWNFPETASAQAQQSLFAGLYTSVVLAAWSACLALVSVALAFGPQTPLQGLLQSRPLAFLSRLTYSIYLVHFGAQISHVASMRAPRYVSITNIITTSFLELICILPICMALYLLIEAPIREVSKNVFKSKRSRCEAPPLALALPLPLPLALPLQRPALTDGFTKIAKIRSASPEGKTAACVREVA